MGDKAEDDGVTKAVHNWRKLSNTARLQESSKTPTSDAPREKIPTNLLLDTFRAAVEIVLPKTRNASSAKKSSSHLDPEDMECKRLFHLPKPDQMLTDRSQRTVEENTKSVFEDVSLLTDAEVINFTATELVGKLLDSKYFRYTIILFIIINSVLIAVETNKQLEREYSHVFRVMDQCITTVFVCEIGLKWYHGFIKFWKQGWNILDFLIVASLLVGPHVIQTGGGGRGVLRILRVLRAFRSLRSISSLPGLQVVVQTILQSVPDMTNIVLLLVIIMLVFSVIGITLFRDIVPDKFGDLSTGIFSSLAYNKVLHKKQGTTYYYGGGAFLVVFISIGSFIFANLVVAVVVTNLESAVKDVKKEERLLSQQLELLGKLDNDNAAEFEVLKCNDIPSKIFERQLPIFVPSFSSIDINAMENYFLILSAMEENLVSYEKLKSQLVEFFDEICEVNDNAINEGILDDVPAVRSKDEALSYQKAMYSGDIVTGLMTLEAENIIHSCNRTSIGDLLSDTADVGHQLRLGSIASSSSRPARRSSIRKDKVRV